MQINGRPLDQASVVRKVGFWSAILASIGVIAYSVVQILQVLGLLNHPLDDVLIYATSLLIAPPFMVAMIAFHHTRPESTRFWSNVAVAFSIMYAVFATLMYSVQLTAVIPYHVKNPALVVSPHSLFWTIDSLAYISMGAATLFAVPAFAPTGTDRWVRWFFAANAVMTPIVATVYYYPRFSIALLLLASPWAITASGSTIGLAVLFKNRSAMALE